MQITVHIPMFDYHTTAGNFFVFTHVKLHVLRIVFSLFIANLLIPVGAKTSKLLEIIFFWTLAKLRTELIQMLFEYFEPPV